MKKKFICGLIILILTMGTFAIAKENNTGEIIVSNKLFSISLPDSVKGTYEVKKIKKGIFIYHKESKKAGFGGFAFGVKPYKNPSEHANMPGGRKIGELTDKKGTLYDMVLVQPTDVQYDYVKNEPKPYLQLYNLAENVAISGVEKNKYFKNQGMKGENLYNEILKKHIIAINEKWDSEKLESENMSYMYNVLTKTSKNVLDKVGYAYYDVNGDGVEELFIGEIAKGAWKGVVYDMYTMVDRKPVHVISGGARNRYYACDKTFVCNEYSSGADESGMLVYILVENSTELFPQVGFKYDGYEDKNNPWFISYNFTKGEWEPVSINYYKERKSTFDDYVRFEYIPLSKLKNVNF